MKKSVRLMLAGVLAASALFSLSAAEKEIKRDLKPTAAWNLYIPGKGNKKDVLKDLNKAGWQVSNNYKAHFSLVDGSINKKKVLKINTLDGKNDALMLPLTGNEKKVTLVFRAQGAVDPDNPQTPYGIFFAYLQNGVYQSMIRHNASNQIKGSKSMVRLTSDGTAKGEKLNIVSDWHEYRFVWDIESQDKMTAQCYIDGKLFHSDTCKKVNFADTMTSLDWDTMEGPGNYLEFGENDGSTNGFGRYAYLLVVVDEDISGISTEDLGKKLKVDLTSNPVTKDAGPQSKRPAKKPAIFLPQKSEKQQNGKTHARLKMARSTSTNFRQAGQKPKKSCAIPPHLMYNLPLPLTQRVQTAHTKQSLRQSKKFRQILQSKSCRELIRKNS